MPVVLVLVCAGTDCFCLLVFVPCASRRAFCTGMSYSVPDGEFGSTVTPPGVVLCAYALAAGTRAARQHEQGGKGAPHPGSG